MSAHAVLRAYGRALLAQLHGRMVLLSVLPFLLSVALWGVLLYVGLQPLIDTVQQLFIEHDAFQQTGPWLVALGLGMLKTVVVPLTALLLLLPLMILTALIFIGIAAMPAIVRHVERRHFATLEKKHGGSVIGSVGTALGAFLLFVLLWCLALPLYLLPPLGLLVQTVLWGGLTYRVMAYDALSDHASIDERRALLRAHRWPLLVIGMVSGLAGALPGVLWLSGTAMSVVLFPFLAAASIWMYVMIFIFTGLWFAFYCLQALSEQRAAANAPAPARQPIPPIQN